MAKNSSQHLRDVSISSTIMLCFSIKFQQKLTMKVSLGIAKEKKTNIELTRAINMMQ